MEENPEDTQQEAPEESPRVSEEDSLLQSAVDGMNDAEEDQPTPPSKVTGVFVRKSRKKLWIALLVLVVLGGIAAGVTVLLTKDKKTAGNTTKSQQANAAQQEKTLTYEPDLVSYSFRSNQTDPISVYYRPTAGGERKEVIKLSNDENAVFSDARGQFSVFASDSKIYASSDGARTYKLIYTEQTSDTIVSLKVSGDGKRLAFATVPGVGNSIAGHIYSIGLDGKDKKEITSSDSTALLILNWNDSVGKIAYSEGCYYCDGARSGYKIYDLKTKKTEDLLPGKDLRTLSDGIEVSDDMKQLIYIQGVFAPSEWSLAPPHQVKTVDLTNMKETLIQTIGTSGEQNANGTMRYWNFFVGFLAGTSDAYYSDGESVYRVESNQPKLLFKSDTDINRVHYVSDKKVIVETKVGTNGTDFLLSNYDVASSKSIQIFEGDVNTLVFGVTTK